MKVRTWTVTKKRNDGPTNEEVIRFFYECYERRFRRKMRGAVVKAKTERDVNALIAREGASDAMKAIKAVFENPKLKWVSFDHAEFLADRTKYERFVVPVMSEVAGEQSEYRGARDSGSVSTSSPSDFFRRQS